MASLFSYSSCCCGACTACTALCSQGLCLVPHGSPRVLCVLFILVTMSVSVRSQWKCPAKDQRIVECQPWTWSGGAWTQHLIWVNFGCCKMSIKSGMMAERGFFCTAYTESYGMAITYQCFSSLIDCCDCSSSLCFSVTRALTNKLEKKVCMSCRTTKQNSPAGFAFLTQPTKTRLRWCVCHWM